MAGTATFFVVSLAILIGYGLWSVHGLPVAAAVLGAVTGALLENIVFWGWIIY
ncbi:MAG: hypothetical protein WDN27_00665 [Candidatus Saccharibacteria bacterium]